MEIITINNKNYNSYANIAEADTFFNGQFGNNWSGLNDITKSQLLVSATRIIDRENYYGIRKDKSQPLKFPRMINDKETDNKLVKQACCEIALMFYNGGGSLVNFGNIESVGLGDSSITFKKSSSTKNEYTQVLDELLSDYIKSGVVILL